MTDVRTLLLLGLLRAQSQHGYQLNESIRDRFGGVTDMSKATAYAILERLAKAGHVRVQSKQQDKLPTRRVYSITPQGERLFHALLRENLAMAPPLVLAGEAGLLFIGVLERGEAVGLLRQRLDRLRTQIAAYASMLSQSQGMGVELMVKHHLALLRADEAWLVELLPQMEEGDPEASPGAPR